VNDVDNYRYTPSALAALEPLPEVKETNSESSWQLFVQLQSQSSDFTPTTPSTLSPLTEQATKSGGISVQDVMAEARRHNRVCPLQPHWNRLCVVLREATGSEPPPPMSAEESAGTPPLVKRIRVRDQVEWAEQHGRLREVMAFFQSLREEQWLHIGR
jgi:hypothetical protein